MLYLCKGIRGGSTRKGILFCESRSGNRLGKGLFFFIFWERVCFCEGDLGKGGYVFRKGGLGKGMFL
jgi:hypothetical protein